MLSLLTIIALVYFGVLIGAALYSERLIFQPPAASYADSDRIVRLPSGGTDTVAALYLPNPAARYTILYSHDNAEDIGHLRPLLEEIRTLGFSVLAYDYRGYGTSTGTPSEQEAYQDVDAAYDFLVTAKGVSAERIIALGRSLGGAIAVDLASRKPVGGLIIESSFVSAYRVMTRVRLFPFDRFLTLSKLKAVRCPVLVIHGTRDEVIPFWHGQRLFEAANAPKLSLWVPDAGHNDLFDVAGGRYGRALADLAAAIEKSR